MIDNIDLSKWILAGIIIYVVAIILVICIRMFITKRVPVPCPYSSCLCEKYCKMVRLNGLSCCKRRHLVNDKNWFKCRRLPKCTCKCFLPRCYCLCCEFVLETEEEDMAKNPVLIINKA